MTRKEAILHELDDVPEALLDELHEFIGHLKQKAATARSGTAVLSEPVLERDWLCPEEDEAWQDL